MTISSVKHAEKMIIRAIAAGPMGSSDRPIVSFVLGGRSSSPTERRFCFEAIDYLEKRKTIFVKRDTASGTPITVEAYDYRKESGVVLDPEPPQVKPTPSTVELLISLHELLKREAGEKGRICNGLHADQYVHHLQAILSKEFDVSYTQVNDVFDLLSALRLRGHARSLRGVGMEVSELTIRIDASDSVEKQAAQSMEMERLEADNAGLLEENATLTEEIDRLSQSIADLRQRNERLALLRTTLRQALEVSDKN